MGCRYGNRHRGGQNAMMQTTASQAQIAGYGMVSRVEVLQFMGTEQHRCHSNNPGQQQRQPPRRRAVAPPGFETPC